MYDKNKLPEQEIDDIVIAQADNDEAWEAPIDVKSLAARLKRAMEKCPDNDA
jgi:hypothetical protein